MPFKESNVVTGIAGEANVDNFGVASEEGVLLPWPSDPSGSWVYYDCTVGVMLDSGITVHNRLPQVDREPDTLSSCELDNPKLDIIAGPGVNLRCRDQYEDIVQRMGHSRYWFRIWGQALRVGLKVPIPGIKMIGGVPAIPYDKNPQWAFNRILPGGNYNGVILWHAGWSLWYTTAKAPTKDEIPAADPWAHISEKSKGPGPDGMQVPYSEQDDNAAQISILSGGGIGKPKFPPQLPK